MLGSMYSAVSGLSAHQTKMDVIGNNIANVNTYGFKSSRVTFSDVFYQTINGASSPGKDTGGTNPMQLGYGAKVNSIDIINTRAGSATTDRPLDVYINGDGFIPVKDSNGMIKYTRVGVLGFDESGKLVDRNGNMVLGIPLDPATNLPKLGSDGSVSAQGLVPIVIEPDELNKLTGIAIGANGEITAIKEGDPTITPTPDTAWMSWSSISNDSYYSGNILMTATRSEDVVFLPGTYDDSTPIYMGATPVSANANLNGALSIIYDGSDYTLSYMRKGETEVNTCTGVFQPGSPDLVTFTVEAVDGGDAFVTIPVSSDPATGVVIPDDSTQITLGNVVASEISIEAITYDRSGTEITLNTTWSASASDNSVIKLGDITFGVDPAIFGTMESDSLNQKLIGSVGPGAGKPARVANMAVVEFANQDGLSQAGEGYFIETTNSGKPVGRVPGSGGTGNLRAGALEMSNVDLSREFTEMIIAQRGFQANTRMITVSDEMLSELVSMKR